MSPIAGRLRSIIRDPGRIRQAEPLKRHTSIRIGGPADYLVQAADRNELSSLLRLAGEEGLPVYILGSGSNLVVSDEGVRGLVLRLTGEFGRLAVEGSTVRVGGGCSLPKLAHLAAQMGLGGIEFACAIPGTVGAGLVMNAGAHGCDLAQVVTEATVVWGDGRVERLRPEEIGFGYRSTRLQGTSAIVVEVVMALRPADPAALMGAMRQHLDRRRATQPLQYPNAGSIFKNPPGDYAGRLIEQAGLKGERVGDAQVSEKHANFIVNLGQATAKDVLTLMDRVRSTVKQRFGVRLEAEVKIWGNNPYFLP